MLNGIEFKNYKPFETGEIEIKPITILLGANSVGKSSIIQLFLLLQETALAENYKSALKLHGGFYSLGEGINLFRKKNTANTLNFKINFRDTSIMDVLISSIRDSFIEELSRFCFYVLVTSSNNDKHIKQYEALFSSEKIGKRTGIRFSKVSSKHFDDPVQTRKQLSEMISRCYEVLHKNKGAILIDEILNPSFLYSRIGAYQIAHAIYKNKKDEILETYDFLTRFYQINSKGKTSLVYDFNYSESVLKIKKFKLLIEEVEIVSIDFDKVKTQKNFVTSALHDFSNINNEQVQYLRNAFKDNKTVFSFIENFPGENDGSPFCKYFVYVLSEIINRLEESFNTQRINYVSPLRAYPKRYYFLDKAKVNTFLDTLDGEAIAEILKDNSILKSSVNNWFNKFNLQINVGAIRDIIHQILVKQNSLDLDITDVGFGVSQVLPVIIQGFLSKENSITLVEQPEIHLHPKMQADLADLFIDIAIDKKDGSDKINKYLIIETHSEYLLKRLRRRISEGRINASNVALYYIEPQEKAEGAKIARISIEEKGAFDWPKDFYTGDLSDDVTVFLENQIS